jgi:hypothetical protein
MENGYDRAPSLPEEYIPEIQEKLKAVGLKWYDFKVTDNSCKPHPVPENPLVAVSPCLGFLRHSERQFGRVLLLSPRQWLLWQLWKCLFDSFVTLTNMLPGEVDFLRQ